jgi:LPXTG-motif cell wall-anchored protein
VLIIIASYLLPGIFPDNWGNWMLVVGFVMMAGGLLILSQWR